MRTKWPVFAKGYYLYIDAEGAYPFFMDEEASGGIPFWMYGTAPDAPFNKDHWWEVFDLPHWPAKPLQEYDPDADEEDDEDDWEDE
jgi:hypothetical protein